MPKWLEEMWDNVWGKVYLIGAFVAFLGEEAVSFNAPHITISGFLLVTPINLVLALLWPVRALQIVGTQVFHLNMSNGDGVHPA